VSRTHRVPTAEAMRELGARLATVLRPGDLVLVNGPLGAGKTTLVQGVGIGLGIAEPVLSPTFVLARVHRSGRIPLVHADAYRLTASTDPRGELADLDLDADLDQAVLVIEWGEGVAEALSESRLTVRIEPQSNGEERSLTWSAADGRRLP
jgi:tRNA threonylcarbamoyladenosine biosynthesis protein TsaE